VKKVSSIFIAFILLLQLTTWHALAEDGISNEWQNAMNLSFNKTYEESINETKLYKFTASQSGTVNLKLKIPTKTHNWSFSVKDSKGLVMLEGMSSYSNNGKWENLLGVEKGDYYLEINPAVMNPEVPDKFSLELQFNPFMKTELEPNDRIEEANPLSLGAKYSAITRSKTYGEYDHDFYQFTISDYGKVSIDFHQPAVYSTNDFIPTWNFIIRDKTNRIYLEDLFQHYEKATSLKSINLPKGTYTLEVLPSESDNSGLYSLSYDFTISWKKHSSTEEIELNDTLKSATTIGLNKLISGLAYSSDDVDYYKFTIPQNGNIIYSMSENSSHWDLEFLDSKGKSLLTYNYIFYKTKLIKKEIGLPRGTYYVKLSTKSVDQSSTEPSRGGIYNSPYQFKLDFLASENYEKEENNSSKTATKMEMNTLYHGAATNEMDTDVYQVKLTKKSQVKFILRNLEVAPASQIGIYTKPEKLVKTIDVSDLLNNPKAKNREVKVDLSAGDYYIVFTRMGTNASYDFALTVPYKVPLKVDALNSKSKALTGTTSKEATVTLYEGVKKVSVVKSDTKGKFSFPINKLKKGKTYTIKVIDSLGNNTTSKVTFK
jgi:hypothetical protein